MALVYAAAAHARDTRDATADTPATRSIGKVNNKKKMVQNKKVYLGIEEV
jgi:hypothetical protein